MTHDIDSRDQIIADLSDMLDAAERIKEAQARRISELEDKIYKRMSVDLIEKLSRTHSLNQCPFCGEKKVECKSCTSPDIIYWEECKCGARGPMDYDWMKASESWNKPNVEIDNLNNYNDALQSEIERLKAEVGQLKGDVGLSDRIIQRLENKLDGPEGLNAEVERLRALPTAVHERAAVVKWLRDIVETYSSIEHAEEWPEDVVKSLCNDIENGEHLLEEETTSNE